MSGDWDFGLHFESSADRLNGEAAERAGLVARAFRFNVRFLDDCLGGILPNDLIVLGARTGAGKTALASIIAQENAREGKRIHYFALEAEPREIERRMKYRALVSAYFRDNNAGRERMSYRNWYMGALDGALGHYTRAIEATIAKDYRTLKTYYRGTEFNVETLDRLFRAIQDETDLIILDHLHYVDSDEPNENRAYKQIVKRIRDISLTVGVPVLLIAHLRKKDRGVRTLVPDIDDFHGSSDITKIATKVILLAPATDQPAESPSHLWATYVHCPKDRMDGSTKNYVARVPFDVRLGTYLDAYELGRQSPGGDEFVTLHRGELPHWARGAFCRDEES